MFPLSESQFFLAVVESAAFIFEPAKMPWDRPSFLPYSFLQCPPSASNQGIH